MKLTGWISVLLTMIGAYACSGEVPTSLESNRLSNELTDRNASTFLGVSTVVDPFTSSRSIELTGNSAALLPGDSVGTSAMCTEETCTGSGGGGTAIFGYDTGFSLSMCQNLQVTGQDIDGDQLDDECEYQIASRFSPDLKFSGGDSDTSKESYWSAHVKYVCTTFFTPDAINFECIEQMWVIRVMYLLGYHRDSQHDGDSEFLVLDVAYVDSEDLWRLARVFMSAHYDSSADKSRWWYHNELHWPDRVMGFPRVWVSEGKHANYPTHGHCEEGGFGTLDTCDEDWNWTARVEVRPQDNIGELNNQLITQVTSKISTFIYPGVECFWCSGWTFGGWLTGGTVMAYRDILNDFMITPGTWDPDIITADY